MISTKTFRFLFGFLLIVVSIDGLKMKPGAVASGQGFTSQFGIAGGRGNSRYAGFGKKKQIQ